MVIDSIWEQMGLENLTNIDDIEVIKFDGPTYSKIIREYKNLFNEDRVSIRDVSEYFGADVEITEEFINGGFEILRAF